jgi:hypothetical protein
VTSEEIDEAEIADMKEIKTQPTPTLDLREFCRNQDTIGTTIYMHWGLHNRFPWIKLAQFRLQNRENSNFPGVWSIDAYLGRKKDDEGDSAFILSFEVIGVKFDFIRYGYTGVDAYINPNLDDYDTFNVPKQDYEVRDKHGGTKYIPEDNRELYNLVRGKRISILTGPPGEND